MHIGVPGHGIVIAVPIKSVGGGKTVAFLNGETDNAAYRYHHPSTPYAYPAINTRLPWTAGTYHWWCNRPAPPVPL